MALSSFTSSLRNLTLTVAAWLVTSAAAPGIEFSGVVAFGDSLTDRGNTINLLGYTWAAPFTEYDETYYDYGNGRWSNGATWVEYLNGNLLNGQTGSDPVDLGRNNGTEGAGTNFAWAGSLSGTGGKEIGPFQIHNMRTQVELYTNLYNTTSFLPEISTTLFTIWTGGNDAIDWVKDGMNPDNMEAIAAAAAANIAAAISDLYDLGARYFLVPNLPGLGNKPDFAKDPEKRDAANAFAEYFNLTLAVNLDALEASLSELTLFRLDVYSLFEDLLANPEAYNISVTDQPAYVYDPAGSTVVSNPNDYAFWDNTHPTTVIHQVLGDLAYQTVTIPEPGSLVFFGIGGAYVLARRRFRKAA